MAELKHWLNRLNAWVKREGGKTKNVGLFSVFLALAISAYVRKRQLSLGQQRIAATAGNGVSEGITDKMKQELLKRVSFSEFLQHVEKSEVKKAFLGNDVIQFALQNNEGKLFFTNPIAAHPGVMEMLHSKGIPFDELSDKLNGSASSLPPSVRFLLVLSLPVLYFLVVGYVMKVLYDQTSDGQIGESAKKDGRLGSGSAVKNTSFDDVAGISSAREIVREVSDILTNPLKYSRVGARLPTGILLIGPPGTGKTMLARAMANESGLPFFYCSGSDFVEVFAGRGASRVRSLFKKAEKSAPCVVFIDEIDALGKSRSGDLNMNEEREQTLNQLLAVMDGFKSEKRVVVMGATNRYDVLDRALVRPGRFDRIVPISLPDQEGRMAILKVHSRNMNLADDCDLELVASICPDFAGADLAMICNEAAIRAARHDRCLLLTEDFTAAVNNHKLSTQRNHKTAYSGSDFVGQFLKGLRPD